jgi:hypothetical protein
MQEDIPPGLEREIRELRKETCPQRVIDEARRKIAAETGGASVLPRAGSTASHGLRYVIPGALACIALLCGVLLARWRPAGGDATPPPELAEQQTHQAADEVETALGLIGTALLDASARSETVVSDRAIAPLQHGFDTARDKIINHTQL